MQRQWYADACTHVLKNKPWDLFVMRYHLPDTAWHSIPQVLDPASARTPEERRQHEALELGIYEACDRLARDLIACVDESETLLALISDHGAKPAGHPGINANAILEEAGLIVRDAQGKIDWSQTRAVARPVCWVHVNLEGREPYGIVRTAAEYSEVQDAIIRALTDYVEPTSGRKPVLFALRKEDARFLNIYGDQAGDVVYALKHDHGFSTDPSCRRPIGRADRCAACSPSVVPESARARASSATCGAWIWFPPSVTWPAGRCRAMRKGR